MKRKVRLAFSHSLCGSLGGACLLASGMVLGSTLMAPVQARDFGFADPYSRGGYYPSGGYYSRDFFYSARPPSRLSDEGYETAISATAVSGRVKFCMACAFLM